MLLVAAENVTLFWLDTPKIAVPVGTVAGVQLALVLKSPVPLRFQVASWACAATAESDTPASSAAMRNPLRDRHRASDPSVGIGNTPEPNPHGRVTTLGLRSCRSAPARRNGTRT